MEPNTHPSISASLCGVPVWIEPGRAIAELICTPELRADERGLIHGGFVFGLADYAAMLAVNDPHVVLGNADARFVAPVRVGDVVRATAQVVEEKGKRRLVEVVATVDSREVLRGTFTAFVLERHVLD